MYTNYGNIPLALAVWLAADAGYDLKPQSDVYSATTLLKPTRSVILSRRLEEANQAGAVDLADVVASRLGTAVHEAAEIAWVEHRDKAFANLGIPKEVANRIYLNADEESDPEGIYVYIEQRSAKKVKGVWVSGKFDFVIKGRVMDIKTTSIWTWVFGDKMDDYRWQGSIYRWLNQDIITDDSVDIMFVFKDWTEGKLKTEKKYPPNRVHTETLPLYSIEETEQFVSGRLDELLAHKDTPEEDLPLCTDQELWMKPSTFAVYKSRNSTKRATKVFKYEDYPDPRNEAIKFAQQFPDALMIERKAEPTFCKWCTARPACSQAAHFVEQGILKL